MNNERSKKTAERMRPILEAMERSIERARRERVQDDEPTDNGSPGPRRDHLNGSHSASHASEHEPARRTIGEAHRPENTPSNQASAGSRSYNSAFDVMVGGAPAPETAQEPTTEPNNASQSNQHADQNDDNHSPSENGGRLKARPKRSPSAFLDNPPQRKAG